MTGWELVLLYVAWLIGGGSPGPKHWRCQC